MCSKCFFLDKDGKGVEYMYPMVVQMVVETISDDGKAVFNFKSKVEKQYKLTGTIDGTFGEVTVTLGRVVRQNNVYFLI